MARPVAAVVFDWGGTLTNFHSVDLIDAWRVAARVLAPDREDEVAGALVAAERQVWDRTATTMRSATTHDVLAAASAATGLDVEAAMHDSAVAAYLDAWTPTTHARPDAVAVLGKLKETGLRTALLSNTHWPRDQHERWLERDGLLDLLDVRVYTSDLDYMKPHPSAFAAAVEPLGVAPAEVVFVGDRLYDDIHGALSFGMRAVWIRNDAVPAYLVEPDDVIDELSDLPAVIAGWS
jgi:putative hydrolase of the HAD superfamily